VRLFVPETTFADPRWAHWFLGLPTSRATVRARGWRKPRRAVALAPGESERPLAGRVVEVPDERVGLLDMLFDGEGVSRQAVVANASLRTVAAQAWVLAEGPRRGWR
jgi:hypothetical protein